MGIWDRSMKILVAHSPQAFGNLIFKHSGITLTGTVTSRLATEFKGYDLDADGLLEAVTEDGEEILLLVEFQSVNDKDMPDRLLEYSFRAQREHTKLVYSCVIFLRKDGIVPEPPLRWELRCGKTILIFDYTCIKLWEMAPEDLLAFNQPTLLPLIPLTKNGASRTMVERVFQGLLDNRLYTLLPTANVLAAQVLTGPDLAWLERNYRKMTDFFKDSPAIRWMTDDAREEGRKEMREQVERMREQAAAQAAQAAAQAAQAEKMREQMLAHFRQAVVAVVAQRFPELVRSAQKQVQFSQDTHSLQQLIINLSIAKNTADAEHYLLRFDDKDENEVVGEPHQQV